MRIAIMFLLFPWSVASFGQLPETLNWQNNNTAPTWSEPNALKGGVFRSYLLGFPPTFRTLGPSAYNQYRYLFSQNNLTLVQYHPNTNQPLPALATKWAFSNDKKTIYFHLDKRAKWSDGEPVTIEDFTYALQFYRNPSIEDEWVNTFYNQHISHITRHSDDVFSITSKSPREADTLLYQLNMTPIPKHFYHPIKQDFSDRYQWNRPPNTGPYRLTSYALGQELVFSLKSNWWAKDDRFNKGRFNASQVVFKTYNDMDEALQAFLDGRIDFIPLKKQSFPSSLALRFEKGLIQHFSVYHENHLSTTGLFFNTRQPLFSDKDLRRTIQLAFFNSLNITQNKQIVSFQPSKVLSEEIELELLSKEAIEQRLERQGWTLNNNAKIRSKNNQSLNITISYDYALDEALFKNIKQNLLQMGINVDLSPLAKHLLADQVFNGAFELALLSFQYSQIPHYEAFFHGENDSLEKNYNITGVNQPNLNNLITQYNQATNKQLKLQAQIKLEQEINRQALFVPLYEAPYSYGYHWRWLTFPAVPSTRQARTIYEPFGQNGIFWIDREKRVETQSRSMERMKFDKVSEVFEHFKKPVHASE